jgi:germination protein M
MNTFRTLTSRVAAVMAIAALVAACGAATGIAGPIDSPQPSTDPSVLQSADPTPPSSAATSSTPSAQPSNGATSPGTSPSTPSMGPSPAPAGTTVVRAYFLLDDGAGAAPTLVPVLRSVAQTTGVARAAMNALLAGPSSSEASATHRVSSSMPAGVTLLGISIASNVATVDLSSAYASGASTAAQISRAAQVVYTLTQFGNVTGVRFEVEGGPLAVPDGSGTVRSGAVGRAQYRERLPEIFVDRPAYGAAIGNPARITGLTRVFEATFRVRLIDGSGRTLADRQVMATCGSGCWGTFDVTLDYTVANAQWGTLRVYNPSAKDGSPEDVRDEPVWLSPAG